MKMGMHSRQTVVSIALVFAMLSISLEARSSISQAEADRLGKDLTPTGAERAGNKDGSIPAWTGGLTAPPAGWKKEQGYVDPFADDKPLFHITAQNIEQYKDKLSPGLVAMLKKYSTFKIPVYQSRRTYANPQKVYDATRETATKASIGGSTGLTLSNFSLGGLPPMIAAAFELLVNWLKEPLIGAQ